MGVCGPDPRRAQLDLRPRPGRPRPGARASSGCRRRSSPASRTTAGHHRAGDRRRADRPGGHQRLRADDPRPVDRVDRATTATARPTSTPSALRDEIDEVNELASTATSTTASTGAASPARQEAYERAYDRLFDRAGLARASGWPAGATWSATPSPRPTCGCSPRWSASTPVYHGHFKCNRQQADRDAGAVGLRAGPVPDARLRRHHRLRPDQAALLRRAHRHQPDAASCPTGPDLAGWLDPARPRGSSAAGRSATAPRRGPPPAAEGVPAGHSPLAAERGHRGNGRLAAAPCSHP